MAREQAGYWGGLECRPLLRAPPFPGAIDPVISRFVDDIAPASDNNADLTACVAALREARVGGTFWGAWPHLDASRPVIARPASAAQALEMLQYADRLGRRDALTFWLPSQAAALGAELPVSVPVIIGQCDPWHLLEHASACWLDASDSEHLLLAWMAGVTVIRFGDGVPAGMDPDPESLRQLARRTLTDGIAYHDPFAAAPSDLISTIGLLRFWRDLIDSNRPIMAAAGFAHWKKGAVEPLLWGGSEPVRFLSATPAALDSLPDGAALALWKARVPTSFLDIVAQRQIPVHEVEDGFIRSAGLGADCVPPLSIVADKLGVHFDPRQPSELENMLQHGEFTPALLERAERLRRLIVETGVSKYAVGSEAMDRPGGARRHILVTGQVEDDRSVLFGGGMVRTNLDLLRRARAQEPDAYILYKPHPDVEAGHRKGRVPEDQALAYADIVVRDAPISALLDMVDGIHVITSLAGFEALIRGKQVTTHGIPFYAGWGLTTDLGSVPERRTARRDVREMVAAVLMLYPRYLDPVTALPCPPEVLVQRLVAGVRKENAAIVSLRRLQGSLRQVLIRMGITI
jgi:capsular polysaccharide export protein